MAGSYLTISAELYEHADRFSVHLEDQGFRVQIEPYDVAYPVSPTFLAKRGSVEHFVEVNDRCRPKRIREWVAYAKTRQHETYVTLVLPHDVTVKADALAVLTELGCGLVYTSASGIQTILVARDLGLSLSLPDLAVQRAPIRQRLRHVYDKFDRGEWLDGFKDACQVVENLARRRFITELSRIKLADKKTGKPRPITATQARKLTLGQLAFAHDQIVAPTKDDVTIGKALQALNKDRVGAVHNTTDARIRNRIRKNVSKHMWTVMSALKVLV